jgi:muconolactone delta-isomerase
MTAWLAENSASGAIEQAWGFAGLGGGGGIVNVDSLEELDALMTSFPYGQVSEVEVYGLTDLGARMERFRAFFEAMEGG